MSGTDKRVRATKKTELPVFVTQENRSKLMEIYDEACGIPCWIGLSLARARSAAGDVEAEHHAALHVLGDVAVGHPQARVGDVEQDVYGLTRAHQHGVLPDQVGLG